MNTVTEICAALKAVQQCTIFMHQRPDGDTVGSAVALGRCLKKMGKRVQYACSDPITPRYLELLDGQALCQQPVGTLIAVDIAAPDMGGRFEDYVRQADIVIDHHESNPGYGKLNLICHRAAAAGEVMYEIISHLLPLDRELAEPLYVAISTDTGCFIHGNTTPHTHRVAADLMETGLDITALNRKLFVIKSRASLMLRNRLLDTLSLTAGGKLATLVLRLDTIRQLGATEDDMENIAGLGMNLEGVAASATLRQTGEGEYKVSLRSDGSVNAAAVCKALGGGGHSMAAGCSLTGEEEACRARITAEMEKHLL